MKRFTSVALLLISLGAFSQDVVYVTDIDNSIIKKISVDPVTGVASGSFTNVKTSVTSAALGADNTGWLYYLNYNTTNNHGSVTLFATKSDGTGSPVQVASKDFNGGSNTNLGFVRLGVDKAGKGWILASDGSSIYLANFTCNAGSSTTISVITNNILTSDGNNSIFQNGDLAFDAQGVMYALANDGNGTTKIYTMNPGSIALNATATLNFKWTLVQQNGTNFNGLVSGAAFASGGSMYITSDRNSNSSQDGLYFIDQTTTNFAGTGTVLCKLVKQTTGLSDLATAYWPAATSLPIRFKDVRLTKLQ